jgi:cell division protein FtsI (penicillin-binding protein 3)
VEQGEKRYTHTQELPASRGRILDRHGTPLATSVSVPSVWMMPREFQADAAQKRELARLLGLSVAEIEEKARADSAFAWLKRQVEPAVWEQVRALRIRGVDAQAEYRRRYPGGEAVAHVIGFTNIEEKGQEGIELAFQEELQGRVGSRRVVRDRLGRVVEDMGARVDPVDGRDVTLSIDAKVQFFAWQRLRDAVVEHAAQAGSVVVLDAKSGEVLALANVPSYSPGERRNLSGAQLRNRAITDIFEPGSTMKPFIAAWSIETGRVTPQTLIPTAPGYLTMGPHTIKDHKPYGTLSVTEVIQKSSNVGTVKMALQLAPREMWDLYSQVGFGQKPELEFPGAGTGRLKAWKTWKPIDQAAMSYGYSISASLLQLARAYTVFARDGEIVPMSIVRRDQPVNGVRVLSPGTARQVREMLRLAAGPGGTAPKAQAMGYSVGGKTGTARKQEGKSYTTNKYRSWFVGLAPASDPRIVVAVMVDEPGKGVFYGGEIAAPVFSQVVQQTLRTLGVPTDIEVKPQILTAPGPAEEESF